MTDLTDKKDDDDEKDPSVQSEERTDGEPSQGLPRFAKTRPHNNATFKRNRV